MTSMRAEHWNIRDSTLHWYSELFLYAFFNEPGTSWRIWRCHFPFQSGIYNVIKVKKYTTWKSVSRHHRPSSLFGSMWPNVATWGRMLLLMSIKERFTLQTLTVKSEETLANKRRVKVNAFRLTSVWFIDQTVLDCYSSCLTSCSAEPLIAGKGGIQ